MKTEKENVVVFKIQNRKGYAAICNDCLTEGATYDEAYDRMVKALNRIEKKMIEK